MTWVSGMSTGRSATGNLALKRGGQVYAALERGDQVYAAQALLAPGEHSTEMLLMLGSYLCWAGRAAARRAKSSVSASEPGRHLPGGGSQPVLPAELVTLSVLVLWALVSDCSGSHPHFPLPYPRLWGVGCVCVCVYVWHPGNGRLPSARHCPTPCTTW